MIYILLIIFIFFISLFIGSFLNVVIDRVIRGEQFIKGRSYCESCKHELGTKDLIPLFSYIFLKGKCRYCGAPISKLLPITELITALTYSFITYWYFFLSDFSINSSVFKLESLLFLLFVYILFTALILLFFSDLKYKLIPDIYTIILAVNYIFFALFYFIFKPEIYSYSILFTPLSSHLFSALSMLVFFGLLYILSRKKALGEGDIYLSAVLALYLPLVLSIVMWFASFLLGAGIGLMLLVIYKKNRKYAVPFGPFLILGFLVALLWGTQIVNWYISLLQ